MKWIGKALLVLVILLSVTVPAWAAEEPVETVQIPAFVNPYYADVLDADPIEIPDVEVPALFREPEFLSKAEAAALAAEYMKLRSDSFSVYVSVADDPDQNRTDLFLEIFHMAIEHTGDPIGGDYISRHYHSVGGRCSYYPSDQGVMLTYNMVYFTTLEQEEELTEAVEELLDSLDLYDATPYEKLSGVYTYMTKNITYDYDGLSDDKDMLEYTAYDALVNKSAVCQGYANLLYRLLLELGVDNRLVSGEADNGVSRGGHAWNIVRLGDLYYSVDSTWDAPYSVYDMKPYFLVGEDQFERNHFLEEPYSTAEFQQVYPISRKPYVAQEEMFSVQFARLNLANEINMQFAFPADSWDDWYNTYAVVEKDYVGYKTATQTIEYAQWDSTLIDEKLYYVISFSGIAAKEMCDEIRVTVYNKYAMPISYTWEDSIVEYIDRNIDKVSSGEAKLYVDMLVYGAAAQTYFAYDTQNLATGVLTPAQLALASESVPSENNQVAGQNYAASRLTLVSRIELQMAFSNLDRSMHAVYSYTNHYGTKQSVTVSGEDFLYEDGMWIVVVNRQVLADVREPVTVKVYDMWDDLVAQAVDSVESYVHRNQNSTQMTAAEKYLHKRILCFADSAYNFFHE